MPILWFIEMKDKSMETSSSVRKLLFWQTKLLEEFPDESGVKDPSKRILPFLPGTAHFGTFTLLL